MIRTALTTLAIVAGLAAPAYAAPAVVLDGVVATEVNHNGSVMTILQTETGLVTISYKQPRAGLITAGVTPGTILFEGAMVQGQLMGDAFAFKQNCRAAAYPVAGTLADNGEIVLRGPGPRRSGCTVTHLDPASPHSVLEFDGDTVALQAVLYPEYIRNPDPAEIAGITGFVPPPELNLEPAPEPTLPPMATPHPHITTASPTAPEPTLPPLAIETPVAEVEAAPVIAAPAVIPSPAAPEPVAEIVAPSAPTSVPTPAPVAVAPAPKPVPAPVAPKPPKPSLNIDF